MRVVRLRQFKIRTDLSRAASWFARVVRPVEGAATGTPDSSGLLCKLLVYADKDLKKLEVLKHGMAWHGILEWSLVVVNKRLPQN